MFGKFFKKGFFGGGIPITKFLSKSSPSYEFNCTFEPL